MDSLERDFLDECKEFLNRVKHNDIGEEESILLRRNLTALLSYLYSNYEHKVGVLAREHIELLESCGVDVKGSRLMLDRISIGIRG